MASVLQTPTAKLVKLGGNVSAFAQDPLNFTFPSNPAIADAGETLLDEHHAIVLRRAIIARLALVRQAAAKAPAKSAAPKPKQVRPLAPARCRVKNKLGKAVPAVERQTEQERLEAQKLRCEASEKELERYYDAAHKMENL
jgi:hypothetical protein